MTYFKRSSGLAHSRLRWGLPLALVIAAAGWFGPWIAHPAAGLVIPAMDLAEYVKFLAEVRTGDISMWREWLLLPAAAVSAGLALVAANRRLDLSRYVVLALIVLAALTALSMLPPVWTPALLMTPEFRRQTVLIVACLALAPVALLLPPLRDLPVRVLAPLVAGLYAAATTGAVRQFLIARPAIDRVYGTPPALGWGFYAAVVAAAGLLALAIYALAAGGE